MITIYHNPRCRKSRETLEIIRQSTTEVEIVNYLTHPPTEAQLNDVLTKLGLEPEDVIRKGEALFKEKFKNQHHDRKEWIHILVNNPILIERPIVIKGGKAVLGRPPEKVKEIL